MDLKFVFCSQAAPPASPPDAPDLYPMEMGTQAAFCWMDARSSIFRPHPPDPTYLLSVGLCFIFLLHQRKAIEQLWFRCLIAQGFLFLSALIARAGRQLLSSILSCVFQSLPRSS